MYKNEEGIKVSARAILVLTCYATVDVRMFFAVDIKVKKQYNTV